MRWTRPPGPLARRLWLRLAPAGIALVLTMSCGGDASFPTGHGRYDVTAVNRSRQAVVVAFLGYEWHMGPCTVRHESALPGPTYGHPIDVVIRDGAGNTIHTARVDGAPTREGGPLRLAVEIPAEDPAACPADLRTAHLLTVRNRLRQGIGLWLGDTDLGTVGPLEERTLGPIEGDWEGPWRYRIKDPHGHEMRLGVEYLVSPAPVIYELGQTPEVVVSITAGYGT